MPPVKRTTSMNPIVFKDFTVGIADHPSQGYTPEQATRANTYRCIANRGGALTPLPKRTVPFAMPTTDAPDATPIAIDGLFTHGIGLLPSVLAFNPDLTPEHELWVGCEWLQAGNLKHRLRRYRRYEVPGTLADVIQDNSTAAPPHWVPTGMSFGTIRSNRAAPTQPGVPVVIANWTTGGPTSYLIEFPDDQAPGSNVPYVILSGIFLGNVCCHQGRVVGQIATAYGHGVDTITFMGENVRYSAVNDVTSARWVTTPQVFIPENPSGYAFMVAMSANELFAVKARGGLYVTGDLSDIQPAVSLPMVTGSDLQQAPVVTNAGVVYGSRTSGVWLWPHGDTSTLLSPQMKPNFWIVSIDDPVIAYGGTCYQFAICDEWVMVPNNWIYDMVLKSWWRLEDADVAQFRFMTTTQHLIYGAESFYTNADPHPIHMWIRDTPSDTYSWQSHPIWPSVPDVVNVAQIELVAEGQGTVTLSLTDLNGDSISHTFDLQNRGFPERFRNPFAIQGRYLQLRIQADSLSSSAPAATIYSVTLNPFTEQPIGIVQ